MTNTIGTKSSMSAMFGSTIFGNAKQMFKAVAEAATAPAEPTPAPAETAARKGRRGTLLDSYA
ncbi:hypothetical protein AB0C07_36280 [Actinoplanes missouriensis]|uniref:hypothetical protein n=1 Tax=Actinoplanes missouriensis TaxID=1866 RepID=UPI00340B6F66